MRLIEQQMISAIKDNKTFCKDNTSVTYNHQTNTSSVYLHSNLIATVGDNYLEIFDGGWQTNTTKSRLNALINGLADGYNQGVYQHKFEWFIRDDWNDTQDVIEFENGYTFKRCR